MKSALEWGYRVAALALAGSFALHAYVAARLSPLALILFVAGLGFVGIRASSIELPRFRWRSAQALAALVLLASALERLGAGDRIETGRRSVAFVGATILTEETVDSEIPNGTVVVDTDGKISAVGPRSEVDVSSVSLTIDASGKFIVPGLINAHDHLMMFGDRHPDEPADFSGYAVEGGVASIGERLMHTYVGRCLILSLMERNAERELRSGVTTTRQLATVGFLDVVLRDRIRRGDRIGPRILAAGQPISITGGHGHQIATVIDGPIAARRAVRTAARERVDAIKITSTGGVADSLRVGEAGELQMAPDEIEAVVEEAHRKGLIVAAHAESTEGVLEALRAGVDNIEHGAPLTPEAVRLFLRNPRTLRGFSSFHPTLSVLAGGIVPEAADSGNPAVAAMNANAEIIRDGLVQGYRDALAGGVLVGAGTDSGVVRHDAVWKEMEYFVRWGGVTRAKAIHMATHDTAISIGIENEAGTLEVGKSGDLLLLSADPRDDLSAFEAPELVVAQGVIFMATR